MGTLYRCYGNFTLIALAGGVSISLFRHGRTGRPHTSVIVTADHGFNGSYWAVTDDFGDLVRVEG